jgi:hypothetical protein
MIALLLTLPARACPVLADETERAFLAILAAEDPAPALSAAEGSLACADVDGETLARLWLAWGASRWVAGEKDSAAPFLAAARALAPTTWDERLGPEMRAAWSSAEPVAGGTVSANQPVRLDGVQVEAFPYATAGGPHAAQQTTVGFGKVLLVYPGEDTALDVVPSSSAPPRRKRNPWWLVASAGAAAGAGGAYLLARAQDEAMRDAGSPDDLNGAYTVQRVSGYGMWGLGGLAVLGVGAFIVF